MLHSRIPFRLPFFKTAKLLVGGALIGSLLACGSGTTAKKTTAAPLVKDASGIFVLTILGSGSSAYQDTSNSNTALGSFEAPQGLAVDSNFNLYIADTNNHVVRIATVLNKNFSNTNVTKVTFPTYKTGPLFGTNGTLGDHDDSGTSALLTSPILPFFIQAPKGSPSHLIFSDNGAGKVKQADLTSYSVSAINANATSAQGFINGVGSSAQFNSPRGLAFDATRNYIYVADSANQLVRAISYQTPYTVSTLAGIYNQPGKVDAVGTSAKFKYPGALAMDSLGNLYVVDTGNKSIRMISITGTTSLTSTVTTFLDTSSDGISLQNPVAIAIDTAANDRMYIADSLLNQILIYDTTTGLNGRHLWPLAGDATNVTSALLDATWGNNPLQAHFRQISGMALAKDGKTTLLFITDQAGNNIRLIKIVP